VNRPPILPKRILPSAIVISAMQDAFKFEPFTGADGHARPTLSGCTPGPSLAADSTEIIGRLLRR
jgi:hypothetical protein